MCIVFFGVGFFFQFVAIDVYGRKVGKKSNSDEFLHCYVSLCNNFADRMRSTVPLSELKICPLLERCTVNVAF